MDTLSRIDKWGEKHPSRILEILRILLGVIIFMKGVFFIRNTDAIIDMLANSRIEWGSFFIAHYVAMSHLVGGVLITIGLITRIAIGFQLPILLGAVVLVNAQHGFFAMESELGFSILVLALLIFFFFYGSGPYSVDEFMKKNKNV